jgi:exodeoxyribonuclease VII small subunit
MAIKIMKKSNKLFKQAFAELEKLTQDLEQNDALDLEKGVVLFEQGMELAQICKTHLSEIENTIITIQNKYSKNNEKSQS